MNSSTAELEATPRLEDVLPGGQPELVVGVTSWGGSIDCWGSERHLILCTTDLGALQCGDLRWPDVWTPLEPVGS